MYNANCLKCYYLALGWFVISVNTSRTLQASTLESFINHIKIHVIFIIILIKVDVDLF